MTFIDGQFVLVSVEIGFGVIGTGGTDDFDGARSNVQARGANPNIVFDDLVGRLMKKMKLPSVLAILRPAKPSSVSCSGFVRCSQMSLK